MRTTTIMYFIDVDHVEYCVMFRPEEWTSQRARAVNEIVGWDVVVAKFNPVTVLDQQGCEFWFSCDVPTLGDAKTFLRMSLPSLVEQ